MMDREGTVIYVGKAKALKNRVSQYFHDQAYHTEKTRAMVAQIDHFDTIVAYSEFEALVLENSLIKRHKPRYNILLKDDKGYPYIRLSVRAPYPKFSIQGRMADDGARYFAPLAVSMIPRPSWTPPGSPETAQLRQDLPQGPGEGAALPELPHGPVRRLLPQRGPRSQHDQAIDQAIHLLEGKFSEVEKDLRTQMEAAAENLEFEKAAALRDRLRPLPSWESGRRWWLDFWRTPTCWACMSARCVLWWRCSTSKAGNWPGGTWRSSPLQGSRWRRFSRRSWSSITALGDPAPADSSAGKLGGAADLSRLLSHQAGRKVDLVTPQRGAKADLIRMAQENAKTECERLTTRAERTAKVLTLLAELLGLPEPPGRIEAYDISNTGASDIVAAMTVFEEGKPRKGRTATSSSGPHRPG